MAVRNIGWLVALALSPAPALAQPAEAPPKAAEAPDPQAKDGDLDAVVVTAPAQQDVQVSIDRRSYSVAKEVQAQTGTLADLLRTVPSVDVDAQGNVTLRGDAGVLITIDGKPTGMFKGEGRGQAVQSLPADQFERVEVISNPSAADSAEGSAGIINLVSKTGRGAGLTGSARISVGTLGQYAGGATLNYNTAKLALTGDVSYRDRDPQGFRAVEARRVISPAGESGHLILSDFDAPFRIFSTRIGADYDLDARTRVGAQARHQVFSGSELGVERFEDRDALGRTSLTLRDIGPAPIRNDSTEGSLSFRRKLGDDDELTADLRQERAVYQFRRPDRMSPQQPAGPEVFGDFDNRAIANTTGAKLNYRRPMADGGELKAGYELRIDDNHYWNVIAHGPAPDALVTQPGLGGAFDYRADIHALFTTYQHRWGELTVLGGVRLENARVTVATTGEPSSTTDRLRPYPSLHLSHTLSETRKLTGSYSRRVERPNPFLLSPVGWYPNDRTIRRGNPELTPPETDSFELGYENTAPGATRTFTLFYRQLHDPIMWLTREIEGGILLMSPENRDDSIRAGASVSLNRKLSSTLSATLSGDFYWTRVQAFEAEEGTRSGLMGQGRASLTWQVTPADLVQADVRAAGRTLTAQGYRTGYTVVNLGYRRRLTPTLFALVTAENVFDSAGLAETVNTPSLVYRRSFRGPPPSIVFGLTYNFGGGPKAPPPPAFEFGAPPG
jgi:outer membrane receptor protein involved in Fe transport